MDTEIDVSLLLNVLDSVLQEVVQVEDGPMVGGVGGHSSDGRLHKVVEGAEEVTEHA